MCIRDRVTGSDLKASHYVRELEDAGIEVHVGHEAATIDAAMPQVVVISTAIPETNPEVLRARELGIPIWPRAKMLSYLSNNATTVAVAGTHGKTTTSSMVATMLDKLGLDPSFLIGGCLLYTSSSSARAIPTMWSSPATPCAAP